VEPCKQYRSIVEFNFIDSTVLINLGDPCKRALSYSLEQFMTRTEPVMHWCHPSYRNS